MTLFRAIALSMFAQRKVVMSRRTRGVAKDITPTEALTFEGLMREHMRTYSRTWTLVD